MNADCCAEVNVVEIYGVEWHPFTQYVGPGHIDVEQVSKLLRISLIQQLFSGVNRFPYKSPSPQIIEMLERDNETSQNNHKIET